MPESRKRTVALSAGRTKGPAPARRRPPGKNDPARSDAVSDTRLPPAPRLQLVVSPSVPEPIRWSRIRTARARVAAGYYERTEVLDRLAAAVLEDLERP